MKKLEWVFGIHEPNHRADSTYTKYGLELCYTLNDESANYMSPIISSSVDDALLNQLLKCKGTLATYAITCLKGMLSIMAKDTDIARYIYGAGPATY